MMNTLKPEALRSAPMEAVAIPLPKLEQTPPVTKMYLVGIWAHSRSLALWFQGVVHFPMPIRLDKVDTWRLFY